MIQFGVLTDSDYAFTKTICSKDHTHCLTGGNGSFLPKSELLCKGCHDVIPPQDPVGQTLFPEVDLGPQPEDGVTGSGSRYKGTSE